jgi:hypothetical protein
MKTPQAELKITVEINAAFPNGATDQIKRAVSENAKSLGFKTQLGSKCVTVMDPRASTGLKLERSSPSPVLVAHMSKELLRRALPPWQSAFQFPGVVCIHAT